MIKKKKLIIFICNGELLKHFRQGSKWSDVCFKIIILAVCGDWAGMRQEWGQGKQLRGFSNYQLDFLIGGVTVDMLRRAGFRKYLEGKANQTY